jgi:hypothetical protein
MHVGLFAAFSLTCCPNAAAVYTGLQMTSQQHVFGGQLVNIFRVYAGFNDPNDYLTAVSGSPTLGPLVILSRNANDTGSGSNFINDEFGSDLTFPAIGSAAIGTSFPLPEFIVGNSFMVTNGGWFTPGPVEEGRAGYTGDGDPLLRVLMMQLTVSSTSNVRGTVAISGMNNNPLAGGQSFTVIGQTFNSIPAPGALPLVGFAALITARRRRTSSIAAHSTSNSGGAS